MDQPSSNMFDDETEEHWNTTAGFNTTATTDISSTNFDVNQDQSTLDLPCDLNRVLGNNSMASNAFQTVQRTHPKAQPAQKQHSSSRAVLPPELVQPTAAAMQRNQGRGLESVMSTRVTSVSLPVQAPSRRSQSAPGIDRNIQSDQTNAQGSVLGLSNLDPQSAMRGSSSATDSSLARRSPNPTPAGPKYQLRVEIPVTASKRSTKTAATTTPSSSDQRVLNPPKGVAGASGSATQASTPTEVRRDTPTSRTRAGLPEEHNVGLKGAGDKRRRGKGSNESVEQEYAKKPRGG
ncbi:hypothetical protein FS749_006792 [Ceratobasidium sp. UAMH 11750]|nr:hypothetical protein FS749_006792 [Ceratobasidium sp. UAMH 11750]